MLGDTALAHDAALMLRACRGRMVVSGISVVLGPVDGYLALAEHVLGRHAEATEAADAATEQAAAWGMEAYLAWLAGERSRLGF